MKQHSAAIQFLVGVFAGPLVALLTSAQEAQLGSTSATNSATPAIRQSDSVDALAAPGKRDNDGTQVSGGGTVKFSAGMDEVIKMIHAGVATDVIKTYIENSSVAYNLSADEIIALKERGVPDELTTAMVKRGGELRQLVHQAPTHNASPPAFSVGNHHYNVFGPESYDYFQYYYLYPRTLADANQRLFSPYGSSSGFYPYSYGYYGPLPYQPLPPSAFQRQ
jgi:hypothetical protein